MTMMVIMITIILARAGLGLLRQCRGLGSLLQPLNVPASSSYHHADDYHDENYDDDDDDDDIDDEDDDDISGTVKAADPVSPTPAQRREGVHEGQGRLAPRQSREGLSPQSRQGRRCRSSGSHLLLALLEINTC